MATAIIAGDLSASLSVYLANELIASFESTLSVNEIILFAMAVLAVATWSHATVRDIRTPPGSFSETLVVGMYDLFKTIAFLSATVVVQLSVMLVRSSIDLPLARIVTVAGTLVLMKVVLNTITLDHHPLIRDVKTTR